MRVQTTALRFAARPAHFGRFLKKCLPAFYPELSTSNMAVPWSLANSIVAVSTPKVVTILFEEEKNEKPEDFCNGCVRGCLSTYVSRPPDGEERESVAAGNSADNSRAFPGGNDRAALG